MTDLFFRAIVPDEVDDFFASLAVAFSDPRPDPEEVETDKKVVEVERTFAAFEEGRIVGCTRNRWWCRAGRASRPRASRWSACCRRIAGAGSFAS